MSRTKKKAGLADGPSLFDNMDAVEGFETLGETDLKGGIGLVYEDEAAVVVPEDSEDERTDANERPTSAQSAAEAADTSRDDAEDALDPEDEDLGGNGDEGDGSDSSDPKSDSAMSLAMTGDSEEDGALVLARYASQAYLEYAMSVVKSRALPEVSDGQKPVQRRILVDMDRMGIRWDAKNVKSARVVGDVLGKYHPHGDQSVYDALVRMAQDFSMRYPLIAGEGNFGSRDGDSQAAMRYTETRLMPIAKLLLDELDQGAVEFVPNYLSLIHI